MEDQSPEGDGTLEITSIIGFNGEMLAGLHWHPDRHHLVYAIGSALIVEEIGTRKQHLLGSHSSTITCIDISKSGKWIGSGQVTYINFKANIIIWDYEYLTVYCKLELHKTNVERLVFTCNDKYLISIGGIDDNNLVVWSVSGKTAICGQPSRGGRAGLTTCLALLNKSDTIFITAGENNLRIWNFYPIQRKLLPTDLSCSRFIRSIKCIVVDADDQFFYCGTATGDIVVMHIPTLNFHLIGPKKNLFGNGVSSLAINYDGNLIVGAGDGTVTLINTALQRIGQNSGKVDGAVTSIAVIGKGSQFFVGTSAANIYSFTNLEKTGLGCTLVSTSHRGSVTSLAFPFRCPEMLATCSANDIRLWHIKKKQEVLRIVVPNMTCNVVSITRDGKTIISGWNDCKIRAFFPESGKLKYCINSTYGSMVSAIAVFSHGRKFISGSDLGHVVKWTVPSERCTQDVNYVTDHVPVKINREKITSIKISEDDVHGLTSSNDGLCFVWDLDKLHPLRSIHVDCTQREISYHPNEHQMVTVGNDGKILFWEAFDGSLIRELDGSVAATPVNSIAVSMDGTRFVTGGDDRLVKLWNYDDGEATHIGIGHSSRVIAVNFSPDTSFIVSVGADGAIITWALPPTPPHRSPRD